jgi:aspartate kinase
MKTVVMKFGGAAFKTPESFLHIAQLIMERSDHFDHLIVVVSAMERMTDHLLALARQVSLSPPKREQDMLISVGERISMSLLAMALAEKGREAISLTGSQSGIITCQRHGEARIIDVRPQRILSHLEEGKIVIVAGFQGVSLGKEITTLGRGGSDTSAVALGVAFRAERVEFYKDVPGIFFEDPKNNPKAKLFSHLRFEEALMLAKKSPFVLHPRSILLASKNGVPLHVGSFREELKTSYPGTKIYGTKEIIGEPFYEHEGEPEWLAEDSGIS